MGERGAATLTLVAGGALAVAGVFAPGLERLLNWAVGALGVVLIVGLVVWWIAGDVAEQWEVIRPNPPTPLKRPRYWPGSAADIAEKAKLAQETQ